MEKQLTPEEQKEATLASYWAMRFKEAMVAKAPYTKRWQEYWDAYRGDYFKNSSLPEYKSNFVSNYIFSVVETIRPIMLDNDPKFQALPRQEMGEGYANDINEIMSYEWDRERMRIKLMRELIGTLVTGTSVFFTPWDKNKKNVLSIPVDPMRIFPDPLATGTHDAEHIIYAHYQNAVMLKRQFPKHAKRLQAGQINYSELVNENDKNAKVDNQILVLEVYTYDYEIINNEDKSVPKYPNGRILTIAPELNLVLSDRANPYKDDPIPFTLIKDYDIPGKFWGEGEVAQLLSPQKHMNELNNAIIDNAKTTANMPWLVDKNSGIPQGKITSRPGLVLRKNPGSQVERMQAPNMPNYVVNAVEIYKQDIEQISGVFDTVKGNSETGVYTAQGILALQEAGQARIRLKVKQLEDSLGELAKKWYKRIQQFWTEDRYIAVTRADGTYDTKTFQRVALDYDYDIKILAGSTMPVNRGAMLDLMIRLAQTPMPDGQNLVDRESVVTYLPEEVKAPLLKRMRQGNVQIEQLSQTVEQMGQQQEQMSQQMMQIIEQLTGAVEQINKKILQVEEQNAKLEEERRKEEETNQIKKQSYNEGYTDAERLSSPMDEDGSLEEMGDEPMGEAPLPDELLEGLESLSDDELAVIVAQNPELADLIK